MSKQEALQHGDIVRYVGPLLAPWMENDLLVSDTDGNYIRVVHNENFTWVPVQDVVCMEEAEEAELREFFEEDERLKDAQERLWDYVQSTDYDGLSERADLARFLTEAKLITKSWNNK